MAALLNGFFSVALFLGWRVVVMFFVVSRVTPLLHHNHNAQRQRRRDGARVSLPDVSAGAFVLLPPATDHTPGRGLFFRNNFSYGNFLLNKSRFSPQLSLCITPLARFGS